MTGKELDTYIELYKKGDQEAFSVIYHETYQNVYYTIYLLTKNKTLIDDYVQDTYLKVIKNINAYKIGTNFKAWISRVAHNLTINALLVQSKEIPVELSSKTEHIFGPSIEPDTKIDKALDNLVGLEKEVFIHLIIEGLSVKETAEIMNVNINRIYYLKKQMEETLKVIFQN